MHGIIAYGAYVPYWRLQRSTIGAALGSGGGKGTRAVASYDEDSTSMGVEAARLAIAGLPADASIATLTFSTSTPPYLDKTNATAIHAALGLDRSVMAADVGGSVRSTVAAMGLGNFAPFTTLTVHADVRTGLPGGADERDGGPRPRAERMDAESFAEGDPALQVGRVGPHRVGTANDGEIVEEAPHPAPGAPSHAAGTLTHPIPPSTCFTLYRFLSSLLPAHCR